MLLAMVADGMGGHAAGEIASATAVETVTNSIRTHLPGHEPSRSQLIDITAEAFAEANAIVYRCGNGVVGRGGMGTTLTTALLAGRYLCIGHVGDSRAFLLHHGRIRQLTRDHTLVQQKVDAGLLTPEEAKISEERNQLMRAIGVSPEVTADVICLEWKKGDALLLCSDGFYASITPAEMAAVMTAAQHPQAACDLLVSRAKARDGSDNITAVCIAPGKTPPRQTLLKTLLGITLGAIVLLCCMMFYQFAQTGEIPIPIPKRQPQEGTALVDLTIIVKDGYASAKWAGAKLYTLNINGQDPKIKDNHIQVDPNQLAKNDQHFTFKLMQKKNDYDVRIQRVKKMYDEFPKKYRGVRLNGKPYNDYKEDKKAEDNLSNTYIVYCNGFKGHLESIQFFFPGPQAIEVIIYLEKEGATASRKRVTVPRRSAADRPISVNPVSTRKQNTNNGTENNNSAPNHPTGSTNHTNIPPPTPPRTPVLGPGEKKPTKPLVPSVLPDESPLPYNVKPNPGGES